MLVHYSFKIWILIDCLNLIFIFIIIVNVKISTYKSSKQTRSLLVHVEPPQLEVLAWQGWQCDHNISEFSKEATSVSVIRQDINNAMCQLLGPFRGHDHLIFFAESPFHLQRVLDCLNI